MWISNFKRALLCLAVFLCAHAPVAFSADGLEKEARDFFEQLVRWEETFDPDMIHVYADDARIRTKRRSPNGLNQSLELTGAQAKRMMLVSLPIAKKSGDISRYSNVRYEVSGEQVTIRAERYSVIKCYTDKGYYIVLRKIDNAFQIIEEYSESQVVSDCEEPVKGGAEEYMNVLLQVLKKKVPAQVDEETRLDDVVVRDNQFEYQFTLVNLAKDEIPGQEFVGQMKPIVLGQSCGDSRSRIIMDHEGIFSYVYRYKDGEEYARFTVDRKDCRDFGTDQPQAAQGDAQ